MFTLNHAQRKGGFLALAALLIVGAAQPADAVQVYSATPALHSGYDDFFVDGEWHRVYWLNTTLTGSEWATTSPSLGGTAVVDDLHDIVCGTGGSTYTVGEIQVRVVDTGPTVDFYWRITSVESGHVINSVNVSNIGVSTLEIDYRPDGSGSVAPTHVTRDDHGYMDFHFYGSDLSGSADSKFFFIRSSGDVYNAGTYHVEVRHDGSSVTCAVPGIYGP